MSGAKVQRSTFYLLGCECCGNFAVPPEAVDLPDFAQPISEPLRCIECRETLLLVECWLADETEMWQAKPGAQWRHVAYADRLPKRSGRQVWT